MSYELTPQQVLPATSVIHGTSTIDIDEIQGDILVGLQKKLERFVFFTIVDVAAFKSVLKGHLIGEITTTRTVIEREHELALRKLEGKTDLLPLVGLNLGFTQTGIDKLISPGTSLGDSSFQAGAAARAKSSQSVQDPAGGPPTGPINDPVDASGNLTTWLSPFLGAIDGVFLITGGTVSAVELTYSHLTALFGAAWTVVYTEMGNVRPGAQAGHEHFGWQDGVSQPAVRHLAKPFPGQTVLEPGLFVFGYPKEKDGAVPTPAQSWMTNGSFMVFRRLKQLVPEFTNFILSASTAINWDPVIIGR